MLRVLLLSFALFLCLNVRAGDKDGKKGDVDSTVRLFNLPADAGPEAVAAIKAAFPNGAGSVRVVEVGDENVVQSTQTGLPDDVVLLKLVTDEKVGGHLKGETSAAVPADPDAAAAERRRNLPKPSWRLKLFVCRVLANAGIAGSLILLKDKVSHTDFEWGRFAATAAVHGTVNGFFQWFGFRVADLAYANPHRTRFFPNFGMRLPGLLARTLLLALPKRVLFTIASVLIYRLTDFGFTNNFDFDFWTVLDITKNIAATLGPAALGLEMAARMGPKEAEGLPPRNNHVFDIQNLTISVLFAAGLAANSKEMNEAFGIHGVWTPIYSAVAIGGVLWWAINSRFTNPDLLPTRTFATGVVKGGVQACANVLGRVGDLLLGRWRNKPQ